MSSWGSWIGSVAILYVVGFCGVILAVLPTVSVIRKYNLTGRENVFAFYSTPQLLFTFLVVVAIAAVTIVVTLNSYRNALKIARGESISFVDFFKFKGLGVPFLVCLAVSAIIMVGMILLYLSGLIAAFVFFLTVTASFVLRDVHFGEPFSLNWKLLTSQFSNVLLIALANWGLNFLGGLVVLGDLVTYPIVAIMVMHALQTAVGGPIVRRA